MTADPGLVVAVTGVGAVSPWGWGSDPLWAGLCSGRPAIGPFDRIDHRDHRTHVAAQVPDGEATSPTHAQRLSLAERFAIRAAVEAVSMAAADVVRLPDVGVFFASSTGGLLEAEEYYYDHRGGGNPDLRGIVSHLLSAPGEAVARHLSTTGPVTTVSSACASGALAIGQALRALRTGEVSMAVAGGADVLCRITYGGFNALRSVDEEPCRPFRSERQGLSLGEGAGAVMLETLDSARSRGAQPLALLAGAGSSSDAHHMTAPKPDGSGAARALEAALVDAGIGADAVDFINAHGTGTALNDAAEWSCFLQVFGERAEQLPVTATKGSIGHYLGAAGAIEAVATVLCLERGRVHPTPESGDIDPATPLMLVVGEPLELPRRATAVSLNLGFGGCNAVLALQTAP